MNDFEYCNKCRTNECLIPEIGYFLSKYEQGEWALTGCPDKRGGECTADLEFINSQNKKSVLLR